jgi:hypothetical protein
MRKPKERSDEESGDAHYFPDFDSGEVEDAGPESNPHDARKGKKQQPARQRVELRSEQQSLRKQLSDWDDYGQDDFDTKL